MKLTRIHHIAIICSDYARSKAFYTEILGLPIVAETYRVERDSHKLDLAVGGVYQLELFSFPAPLPRVNSPEAACLRHLAFEVRDVEHAVAELRARGVEVEPIRVDDLTGRKFTFFKDPDGLPLELYQAADDHVG